MRSTDASANLQPWRDRGGGGGGGGQSFAVVELQAHWRCCMTIHRTVLSGDTCGVTKADDTDARECCFAARTLSP